MKYLRIRFFFTSLILLVSIGYSQTIDSLYEVGTWQGFRTGAVSFTFDDGTSNQFAIALPMFDEYGFKMTLFTVINWSPNWTALQTAASNGHEVASHTLSHPHLGTLDSAQQTAELKNSHDTINAHIPGNKCITIAYPYCEPGNNSICKQYYIAARGCSGVIEPSTPPNFLNISSFGCGNLGTIKTSQDFSNKCDNAASLKGWVVFLIHGIDNDGGYSPVTTADLRGALDYLNAHTDKFWVSTFSNVACYIKERNSISVNELSFEDSIITLSVTDTLDNSLFSYPVTIRRLLPQGWPSALISQNGNIVNAQIVEVNSKKYVMFDAVPDMGDIQLKKNNVVDVSEEDESLLLNPHLMQNYPNPFNPQTKISFQTNRFESVTLKIYDVLGKEIATLVNEEKPTGIYEVEYNPGLLSSGIYFYQLKTNKGFVQTKKLILSK